MSKQNWIKLNDYKDYEINEVSVKKTKMIQEKYADLFGEEGRNFLRDLVRRNQNRAIVRSFSLEVKPKDHKLVRSNIQGEKINGVKNDATEAHSISSITMDTQNALPKDQNQN